MAFEQVMPHARDEIAWLRVAVYCSCDKFKHPYYRFTFSNKLLDILGWSIGDSVNVFRDNNKFMIEKTKACKTSYTLTAYGKEKTPGFRCRSRIPTETVKSHNVDFKINDKKLYFDT